MDKNGESGQGLRNAFKDRINLSDADSTLVLKLMVKIDSEFAALDSQANAIISKAHEEFEASGVLPPPPPKLAALQDNKKSAIHALSSRLTSNLSSDACAAIRSYLMTSRRADTIRQ